MGRLKGWKIWAIKVGRGMKYVTSGEKQTEK